MCGGIISGLQMAIPNGKPLLPYAVAYNLGRISSYSLAGALTGFAGAIVAGSNQTGIQILHLISGLFLLAMACYIGGWWRGLQRLEQQGKKLWKYIAPASKRFIPFPSPFHAVPYGFIWGWLPCGLVYSTLTWSLAAGSPSQGLLLMLCFGLGTLPSTILVAFGASSIRSWLQSPRSKQLIALILAIFALYSLSNSIKISLY